MRVRIGDQDASQIAGLLRDIGNGVGPRADLIANAAHWARAVHGSMDRRDAQTVSWLLAEIGRERRMPKPHRRIARYWSGSIAARL